MAIQTDLSKFPFQVDGSKIWYLVVRQDGHTLREECFTASGLGKRNLVTQIRDYQKAGIIFAVYGVWTGQYRTDIFLITPHRILKEFSGQTEKEEQR